jgi:opacity protein-like surface antigen
MRLRFTISLALALLACGACFAQDSPKAELTGDYSYFRLNPGLPSVWNSQNLNGGGGQVALYFKPWLALAADLQGYGSFTQCPKTSSQFTGCASGNLFTYTFGPQIKYRAGKLEPFAEVLLGGAHTNFYANACNKNTGECGSRSPSNNASALAIGGGLDIVLSSSFAIRLVDADYELTRFGNNFTAATTARATSDSRRVSRSGFSGGRTTPSRS